MKYLIRQRVINQYGLPVVKIEQVTGELGSKILDKNGNEIFEGDIVRHEVWEKDIPVTFHDGAFWLGDTDCPLCYQFGKSLEIVGHVEDITP